MVRAYVAALILLSGLVSGVAHANDEALKPTWSQLSDDQRKVLAPLSAEWDTLRPWQRGPLLSAPLYRFYENDLLAYCQAIWRDLPDPAQFVLTCLASANLAQLWRVVDARLAEVAAGPRAWLRTDADTCPEFHIARPPAASSGSAP